MRRTADLRVTAGSGTPAGPAGSETPAEPAGWWRRHLHRMLVFAARTYFQVRAAGTEVPAGGPVLLVANHPNSLLDPALVAVAAKRPVRFLAGAHLFRRRSIAWAVRGSGAIPVFRRSDEPADMARNQDSFRAVRDALLEGSVVGVFPEGLTHAEPALVPLKTGAARIALSSAAALGTPFPILPVGITFRGGRDHFRSQALLLVGKPVRWSDLAGQGSTPAAVRDLTRRIEEGLARVTVNLEHWEDLPLVEVAEAVHHAEFVRRRRGNPVRWLARMRRTATALSRARQAGGPDVEALDAALSAHARVLGDLGLTPADLHVRPGRSVAVRWTLKNLLFFGLALPLAMVGNLVFWLPWTLVRRAEPRFGLDPARRATYRVLGTAATCGGWVLLLAALVMEFRGWRPALALLAILPLTGLLTLRIRSRWRDAAADLERFLFLHGRGDLRTRLLADQRALAEAIRDLLARI
jgi:glycerol-3-phosphate O-acyltransferase / dihydroxyacetone phosphate acyltransferase